MGTPAVTVSPRRHQAQERRPGVGLTIMSSIACGVGLGGGLPGAIVGGLLGWFVGVKAQKEHDEKNGK